jgi:hypothetical protein
VLVIRTAFEALESNDEADAFLILKHALKPKLDVKCDVKNDLT